MKDLWNTYPAVFDAAARAAGFRGTELTSTPAGPLMAWERPCPGRPTVYLSAGIHGDEAAGPLALLAMMREGFFDGRFDWRICPALNPTGLAAATRENIDGTDLNRDYSICTSREIAAHKRWLASRPVPVLFISLHEDVDAAGFYLYEINLGADDPTRVESVLRAVEPWFTAEPHGVIDGHETRGPGWIFHAPEPDLPEGWPEAIHLAKAGCPLSFTLETPGSAEMARRCAAHVAAVRAILASVGKAPAGDITGS
jgi:protein MpaA